MGGLLCGEAAPAAIARFYPTYISIVSDQKTQLSKHE